MLTVRQNQLDAIANSSPGTQMVTPCPADATWIEVQLVDMDQTPMPGEKYRIKLPDSSLMEGVLDKDGKVRFNNIVAGQADITFPEIDKNEWDAAAAGGSGAGGSGGGGSNAGGSGGGDSGGGDSGG